MLLLAIRTMPRAASVSVDAELRGDRVERAVDRIHVGDDLAAAEVARG